LLGKKNAYSPAEHAKILELKKTVFARKNGGKYFVIPSRKAEHTGYLKAFIIAFVQ
jgi:hypothetical protein